MHQHRDDHEAEGRDERDRGRIGIAQPKTNRDCGHARSSNEDAGQGAVGGAEEDRGREHRYRHVVPAVVHCHRQDAQGAEHYEFGDDAERAASVYDEPGYGDRDGRGQAPNVKDERAGAGAEDDDQRPDRVGQSQNQQQ